VCERESQTVRLSYLCIEYWKECLNELAVVGFVQDFIMRGGLPSPSSNPSWHVSIAAIAVACTLLPALASWRSSVKHAPLMTPIFQSMKQTDDRHRQGLSFTAVSNELSATPDTKPNIDDDVTRDDTCRRYLMNFLNGTTDAKDECQGMYNAWSAADCKDDSKIHTLGRKHTDANGNITDDNVMIDDYYENWECCASISDFYGKHCQEASLNSWKLCGIVSVLIFCGIFKSWVKSISALRWIPDAGTFVLVGALVGGFLRLINHKLAKDFLTFDNDLFLHILLPPIVFEAAISINKRAFRRDLFPILMFAIFGTALSAVAIGYITYTLSALGSGPGIPFLDSLIFGALMSSIDPVATLGLLSVMGVNQGDTLYTLIFGESLLNDGVAIVLFDSLVHHIGDDASIDKATISNTLYSFLLVIFSSMAIGIGCGMLASFYFWLLQGKHTAVSEVALFFSWALVPYYIADALGMSGIISIMVMGFMMDFYVIGGHQSDEQEWMDYMAMRCAGESVHPVEPRWDKIRMVFYQTFSGRGHIMSRSRNNVGFVAEVISRLMETSIFAYLGLFLFNDKSGSFQLLGTGIFSCVASRLGMVVLLSLVVNACVFLDLEGRFSRVWRRINASNEILLNDDDSQSTEARTYLDIRTQIVLFSAGVRGAVSYALVQNIPVYDAVTKKGSHFKGDLKAMTSATIVVLLFSFGALTYFTVNHSMNQRSDEMPPPLHQRLMSEEGLASTDGEGQEDSGSDINTSLEIEGRGYFQ
jgi:NhaP-type Na+/H+ or K+/H+ antiporter